MPVLHRVRLLPNDTTVFAAAGTTLYDAVRDAAGMPDAVCGGNGRCGKCALELLENGRRTRVLACRTVIDRDMTVFLPEPQKQRILSGGITRAAFPLTPADGYAAAFDIGTTTLVCSLLERGTGQELITLGALNPQASFGADVIARIKTALEIGVPPLTRAVLGGMNRLLGDAAAQAGISLGEITLCSIAGNSCMQHLLLGLPVRPLASAPYAPVSTEAVVTSAGSLGLALPPETSVRILPLIGGFVGADTVGCLLATDFANGADDALLLDIGTNGELVLRHGGRLVACSAAAGPALEGGNISCGMRGSTGAIDHAAIADGKLRYTVIGGGKPVGLCGSGLIDLISCLLDAGAIGPSGRFLDDGPFPAQMIRQDGMRAFCIASAAETGTDEPLLLTQKDVREVQLAKSAISSAIVLLANRAGTSLSAIGRVLLAGAFGNFLNAHSACRIGLIPAELESRIEPVGNAAGAGARLAALSDEAFAFSRSLAAGIEHVELASDRSFQNRFIAGLAFDPHH